jgi:hypothetical protein
MKIIKLLSGLATVLIVTVSQAQTPINVIVTTPPGGLAEKMNLMAQNALEGAGYKTNLIRYDNCKGAENWLKNNPGKPAVFDYLFVNQAMYVYDPDHPGGCNLPLIANNIISTVFRSQFQTCSILPREEALRLWKSGQGKLGITATPDLNGVMADRIVGDVTPNTRVIRYKGNPALLQAMTSREIDFVGVFSNAGSAVAAGAQCFFTLGDRTKASKFNLTSVDDVKPNSVVKNLGYMSGIVGFNVDTAKLRPVIINAIKTDPELQKQVEAGLDFSGVVVGQTMDQQWQEIDAYIKKFKK